MYRHFSKIAETVDLPMILYNVPGRTVADMSNDTMLRLAQVPGIIGIKEATGNIERAHRPDPRVPPATSPSTSGDDPTAMALILLRRPGQYLRHRQRGAARDARDCALPRWRATSKKRVRASTTACCRCTRSCSSRPTRCRSSGRWREMGMIEHGLRLPLVPLSERFHEAVRRRRCARPGICACPAHALVEARHDSMADATVQRACALAGRVAARGCQSPRLLEATAIDYKSASNAAASLEVPPDLTQLQRDNRYALPEPAAGDRSGYSRRKAQAAPGLPTRRAAAVRTCASSAPAASAGWW